MRTVLGEREALTARPDKRLSCHIRPLATDLIGMRIRVGSAFDSRSEAHLTTIAEALLENASTVVGGHVPVASRNIVDVLAPSRCHWAWFAGPEAEQAVRYKVLPSTW